MVTPHRPSPGAGDPDDDPTGVRELLGRLPDPHPMPDDLVARITASLSAEQVARSASDRAAAQASVTALASRRRPAWRTLGLAAAAAAVVGIGGTSLLTGTSPGDLAARLTTGGSSNDTSAAGSSASMLERDGSGADSGSGAKGLADQAGAAPSMSGTAYESGRFAAQLSALRLAPPTPVLPGTAEAPGIGPIGTATGLRDCVKALGLDPQLVQLADLGTYDGVLAAVILVQSPSGVDAYAVRRSCTTGSPATLAGPVPVP